MTNIFETAFQHMPTPAFVIESSTGKILSCNNGFTALFENFHTTPAASWDQLCADSNPEKSWDQLHGNIKSGKILRCQSLIKIADKRINMQLEFQYLEDSVLVCVYNTDHMDLSAAENTLLQFALAESSAGLWLWETDSNLISCSKSIATLLGCSTDQTPTSTIEWHQRVHPDDAPRLDRFIQEHIEHKQEYYEIEYRFRKEDSSYIWVKERGKTYSKTTDGSIKQIVGFIVDISHQKALEEHLRNQATLDELTGLLTRTSAIIHFKKQLGLAKRQYTPLTMAKIHLDANDQLSSLSMEDRNIAIQTSARYLFKKMRESDILARVESNKLLLLLPNTSVKDAVNRLNYMINPTDEEAITLSQGNVDPMNFCVGIATFPEDGDTIEELAESANEAVQTGQAKQQKIAVN
ncbi:PAS domain-containing protein [Marinomonas sp. C2222]|uniref:PAS domain-containing protein n=1 Tax=Marinomonas sargassi TaxID=2984494 RepID=A0ABT2YU12_9GAMM|nr:PAS domain-containing protein [Marinomonas sargassi]MCV2403382.1 PAS domain-containing protein [Marinomonas sargassi]